VASWALARECRSPKKEEGSSTQTAQASTSAPVKTENKPIGSANTVVYNFEGDRFWLAEEDEEAHMQAVSAEPDLLLEEAESADASLISICQRLAQRAETHLTRAILSTTS
jgi:hypothetical protein